MQNIDKNKRALNFTLSFDVPYMHLIFPIPNYCYDLMYARMKPFEVKYKITLTLLLRV